MPSFPQNALLAAVVGFLVGSLMTLAVRRYATGRGFVAKPKADRWHRRPTAMLGGVAIYIATLVMCDICSA